MNLVFFIMFIVSNSSACSCIAFRAVSTRERHKRLLLWHDSYRVDLRQKIRMCQLGNKRH
jgi:hypothetical protein